MLWFIFNFFIIAPFIEWLIHYSIHKPPPLKFHKQHHLAFFNKKNLLELWVAPVILFFIFINFYITAFGFFKYFLVHNTIHYCPELTPTLSKHHILHHRDPSCNFAVSSTIPDRILKTFKNSDDVKIIELE